MADEKDKKSDLVGWAAVLTAIATLITAIGFPNFFPDLVKQTFLKSSSQSAPSATPSTSPEVEGVALPSNPAVSPRETKISPVTAVLNLRQGMPYLEARSNLFSAGWKPAEIDASESENLESPGVNPSERFSQNLPELHLCQPTGLGLCSGELELEDGRTLAVTVTGIDPPSLIYWDSSFYIEPSEATLNAIEQLRIGLPYRKIEQFLVAEGWRSPIANPMYRADELPSDSLDFLREFSNFEECQVDGDEIKTCRFIFFTEGERKLTITTDITRVGSQYDPIIQSWSLD